MKILDLTEENIASLPNGKYCIFKDNILSEMIYVENIDNDGEEAIYPIAAMMGSDEIFEIKDMVNNLSQRQGNYKIVDANEIKLEL